MAITSVRNPTLGNKSKRGNLRKRKPTNAQDVIDLTNDRDVIDLTSPEPEGENAAPDSTHSSRGARLVESADDYQLRLGPGWTLNDGTYEHVPENKRRRRDVPYPSFIDRSYRSMLGLNTLQLARDAPINLCAMDIATEHVWRCLPDMVKSIVRVAPPNGPALWSIDEKNRQAMYEEMARPAYLDKTTQTTFRFYADLKETPWVVWPLWVEDEWGKDYVLAAWYAEAKLENTYDRLRALTIYDPRRDPLPGPDGKHGLLEKRLERIRLRLLEFLRNGDFDVSQVKYYDGYCSPMALGEATSGERCFAAVKELLEDICRKTLDGSPVDSAPKPFPDMARWVHPYQFRIEMAGINAWVLMATFDFNARIAVECVMPDRRNEIVADGRRRILKPDDLAGRKPAPPLADKDYRI
ncbi:hypothetical protein GGS23DRAFT_348607 [Durotheca rogersii]|uniref:uncharacterized protein n=1 Tax=Durotheca rogersii TaxID=419775 RepID=UPI00221ED4C8|nr:uncharacterized protein GGS23DRAFT_348607 [Durotheca rogersii]KAI5857413.1 hypothetical protein GGS23DRAFT_348607 [Durotheca rogersii]